MSDFNLKKEIEKCREEMIMLSYNNALTSEVVVSTSMKLDKLINEYLKKAC
ncbi:Spo0E family sporulation regulatory protein-aspartic acid phosphatase [Virgibacillus halodenitrificans]|uniref:Aspartyl-phosphate phosphatase Spo0E family protein n=1 Tax=Virgibacillus halodenitrificans TaxID=1482 RepID=A0ABR7VNQ1_VIRHA|nr:aspartyl-phosphate phosphatase Spo0E family protein [Virgibacillus halodenitrificans]MBD1222921.1 aspartyl-phosphate phosphatase Spo0E family protein [Virgibacillus halodenitrificans]MCG1027520.1 aspartyl-phosphate phosphatase Spo0E family protein [Virgibacillus halodenitrificans]MCJ0930179.1 aspartyl-phosphate phosphatase Spo0E family protein [Virgibacillus halodenitrificans]MEC2159274.1 aspartyl-phosphate phosphatase Spo0E family protein [Virgibacillus halodenitrificans]MYL47561.1 Spo0E f